MKLFTLLRMTKKINPSADTYHLILNCYFEEYFVPPVKRRIRQCLIMHTVSYG
jgi:hypothetical protein